MLSLLVCFGLLQRWFGYSLHWRL
uniref:Uncharacterized protein n=1 Tax=Arundo donax TaxID=35708 RepID=A0A0A8Z7L3_ARUDO